MKRIAWMLLLFCSLPALGTTTVTGKVQKPDTTAQVKSAYVHFQLMYCGANQARVIGTSVIPATVLDVYPDSSGNISTTLYGNDQITCGTTTGNSRWRVTYYTNNQAGASADFNITGGSFDLTTALPVTVVPTVTSPTGDTTYLRTDLGNLNLLNSSFWNDLPSKLAAQSAAAPNAISGSVNGVINPMAWPFNAKCDGVTDDSAALQSAINLAQMLANGQAPGAVEIPSGRACVFGTTLQVLESGVGSVSVRGSTFAINPNYGAELDYTGTGNAIEIAQSGSGGFGVHLHDFILRCKLDTAGTRTCGNLIDVGKIMGPLYIERVSLQGEHNNASGYGSGGAANGIVCNNCGIQIKFKDNTIFNFRDTLIKVLAGTNVSIQNNQMFDAPTGLLLTGAGPVNVADNYFELINAAVKVTNDVDWTRGQYDIYGNEFNLSSNPPVFPQPQSVLASRRCLLVTNSNQALEMGAMGSFHDNQCNLSEGYAFGDQTNAPYGVEFSVENPAVVDLRWKIENNQFAGVTTSGVYSNSALANVTFSSNLVTPDFNRSFTSTLPEVSGSGTYLTYVKADASGNASLAGNLTIGGTIGATGKITGSGGLDAGSAGITHAGAISGVTSINGTPVSGLIQNKRGVAGCTTPGTIGSYCASSITVTWGTAFADANYAVHCTGNSATNTPGPFVVNSKTATAITVNYAAFTNAAAAYTTIDCTAIHD